MYLAPPAHSNGIVVALILLLFFNATNALAVAKRQGVIACSAIPAPELPGVNILSISAVERLNVSGAYLDQGITRLPQSGLNYCEVNVTIAHTGVNESILVEVWLPINNWNGRFQGQGGGGYFAGYTSLSLGSAVGQGFVGASTDGGNISLFSSRGLTVTTKIYDSSGQVNLGLFNDFAARSLHEMAVIGKAVTNSYYGRPPHHSYWVGCSQGGRQGYMMAQRYPTDFNGILARAPAINWQPLFTTMAWPQFIMSLNRTLVPSCVFDTFLNASIALCDPLDGLVDGIVSDPTHCPFDPNSLIGKVVLCNGQNVTITQAMADIVRSIHDGPHGSSGLHLWDGYEYGASYTNLANTRYVNGQLVAAPLGLGETWINYYGLLNPSANVPNLTLAQFTDVWIRLGIQFGAIIQTALPDLTAFRDSGGKLLTWHGLADQTIPPNNTLYYRRQLESIMGGYDLANQFYRIFFSGGARHCGGGNGPIPTDELQQLMAWVENGTAPTVLNGTLSSASGTVIGTRPICLWPQVARYDGKGNPNQSSSFSCSDSY